MLVVASGFVTGKGMQISPPRISPKPNNLRTFFIWCCSSAPTSTARCWRSCVGRLACCIDRRGGARCPWSKTCDGTEVATSNPVARACFGATKTREMAALVCCRFLDWLGPSASAQRGAPKRDGMQRRATTAVMVQSGRNDRAQATLRHRRRKRSHVA
jgi:hypothetical protein